MRIEKNRIRLFPEYFDRNVSRRVGRRLPRNNSIKDPNLLELKLAAQKMGLETDLFPESSHPSSPTDKKGMLVITLPREMEIKKSGVIKRISELTTSFSRPLLQEKRRKEIENKKQADKKKDKRYQGTSRITKSSDKQRKGPKPRRR
ncbi:MAG: Signal recognition particle 19 kDa protein [Candidatus Heimdallarchaeota archaeon LC_3]|nr:MAG: Signal recognition particle 19 kDa protein [Candidatus Heimdallarchaeota archaeon LC_3]